MPEAPYLCAKCRGFAVDDLTDFESRDSVFQHHDTLQDLRSSGDPRSKACCSFCQLLWASIRVKTNEAEIKRLLRKWPRGHTIVLHQPGNCKASELGNGDLNVGIARLRSNDLQDCLGSVDLFAHHDNPASRNILNRFSEINSFLRRPTTSTDYGTHRIRGWLDECCSGHDRCGNRSARPLPDRLVDIKDPGRLRLVDTKGDRGRYVALSYCWGEKINGQSIHKIKLKTALLPEMMHRLDSTNMTLTHLEGIQIARGLGYRYIWIDALCIIQDSDKDWERQAHKVPDIYSNAELTIMAGRSDDSRRGFLDPTRWYRPAAAPVILPYRMLQSSQSSKSAASCGATLKRNLEVGPTQQRAWCFQESILSRRIVTYGCQQLMFQCREGLQYDDSGFHQLGQSEQAWYDLAVLGRPIWPNPAKPQPSFILFEWYRLAEEYSRRQMFHPLDCFAALAGVAKKFQIALGSGRGLTRPRYNAGIWETDVMWGLMWRSSRIDGPSRKPGLLKALGMKRAPSWSWMALEGPVRIPGNPGRDLYCSPALQDGLWAKQDWGIDLILPDRIRAALPCTLSVRGCLRRVHVSSGSSVHDEDLSYQRSGPIIENYGPRAPKFIKKAAKWRNDHPDEPRRHRLSQEERYHMQNEGALLQSRDGPRLHGQEIVAAALFDIKGSERNISELWAMPTFADRDDSVSYPTEGLVLSRNSKGAFVRRGVFWVIKCEFFMGQADKTIEIQ